MNFGDWAGAVQSLTQAGAIAVAGVWAYYKFARGRTFAHRAEASVEGELVEGADGTRGMAARLTLRNTGASDIPLHVKGLYVYGLTPDGWGPRPEWTELGKVAIFEAHAWIEAQESIADAVLVPLAATEKPPLAYRLEAKIYERTNGRWWRGARDGGIRWTTTALVPGTLRPVATRNETEEAYGERPR